MVEELRISVMNCVAEVFLAHHLGAFLSCTETGYSDLKTECHHGDLGCGLLRLE